MRILTQLSLQLTFLLTSYFGHCVAEIPGGDNSNTIIITCATGALGTETAKLLASDHNLILTGRNVSALQQLQKELQTKHSFTYTICPLDYSKGTSITQFKDCLNGVASKISGIVLITPRPQFYGKELLQEEAAWLDVFKTTFTGPLEVLKGVIASLAQQSKIVVIAGTTSVQFQLDAGPSCVIRRMWTTYAKALSHQLGPQGISVNTVSPGVVLTNFHQERIQKKALENKVSYEEQMGKDVASIPLKRHAKPVEVAQTIRFLLSKDSDFINGANLVLDGGLTVSY